MSPMDGGGWSISCSPRDATTRTFLSVLQRHLLAPYHVEEASASSQQLHDTCLRRDLSMPLPCAQGCFRTPPQQQGLRRLPHGRRSHCNVA